LLHFSGWDYADFRVRFLPPTVGVEKRRDILYAYDFLFTFHTKSKSNHDSSLKRSRIARVNEGSYSLPATHTFIRKWNEPYLPLLPSRRVSPHFWLVLISRPAEGRRLSLPVWLAEILRWFSRRRRSPIPVLTGPDVAQLRRT